MKRGKISEQQIVSALKKQESGMAVKDIGRERNRLGNNAAILLCKK